MNRAARRLILGGVPGWVLAAYAGLGEVPDVVGHYDDDRYWIRGIGELPVDAFSPCTRASPKYAVDSNGVYVPVDPNRNPRTNLGLLAEIARTNSIRTSDMTGAVAGTPGTRPNNWASWTGGGLSSEVVAVGIASNGIPFIRVRVYGTAGGTASFYIWSEGTQQIAALQSQTWTQSAFLAQVGGTQSNISAVKIINGERNSSGGSISDNPSSDLKGSLTSVLQRFSHTTTLPSAATAYIQSGVRIDFTAGAIDITLDIGPPQLELGAFATSPILTTNAAAMRAADAIRISNIAWFNASEGTLFADLSLAYPANGVNQMVMRFSDNSYNNSIVLNTNSTGYPSLATAAGGVFDGTATSSSVLSANTRYKFAGAYKANDLASSKDGGTVVTDASATIPSGLTRCDIGSDHATANHVGSGYIRRVAYFPARLTNAQLQALTT